MLGASKYKRKCHYVAAVTSYFDSSVVRFVGSFHHVRRKLDFLFSFRFLFSSSSAIPLCNFDSFNRPAHIDNSILAIGKELPTSARSLASSMIIPDDFSLDDSLIVVAAISFSSSLCSLPIIAFFLTTFNADAFTFDFTDAILSFAADGFGEGNEFLDILLKGC